MSDSENILMVADSERDANMLYAVGMFVPDPFIYFRVDGHCHVVVNDLEVNRMRKKAPHCRVISYPQCLEKLGRKTKRAGLAKVINFLLARTERAQDFRAGQFSPRAGAGIAQLPDQGPRQERRRLSGTRIQKRGRNQKNQRRPDDGGGGAGRGNSGAQKRPRSDATAS